MSATNPFRQSQNSSGSDDAAPLMASDYARAPSFSAPSNATYRVGHLVSPPVSAASLPGAPFQPSSNQGGMRRGPHFDAPPAQPGAASFMPTSQSSGFRASPATVDSIYAEADAGTPQDEFFDAPGTAGPPSQSNSHHSTAYWDTQDESKLGASSTRLDTPPAVPLPPTSATIRSARPTTQRTVGAVPAPIQVPPPDAGSQGPSWSWTCSAPPTHEFEPEPIPMRASPASSSRGLDTHDSLHMRSVRQDRASPDEAVLYDAPTQPPAHGMHDYESTRRRSKFPRRWWPWLLGLLAIVILAVALGAGLGAGLNHDDDTKNSNDASQPGPSGSAGGANSQNLSAVDKENQAAASSTKGLQPLGAWSWTSATNKVFGVNLGGLLVLERWLYEDWMVQVGGPTAWDEHSMSQLLGDKMDDALNHIIETWVTEPTMDTLQKTGVNMVRVPIGYWPFLSTQTTGEPYRNTTQLTKLSTIMHWAWKRNMYVLVDLHAMPGSQNNDQSSGWNNTALDKQSTSNWYTDDNQKYSKQAVTTALQWLSQHPAKSVIAGITTVNEPKVYNNDTYVSKLKAYYDWSLEALSQYNWPLIAHHAFVQQPYTFWRSYASSKSPDTFILDDHPYPAWYQTPELTDMKQMSDAICNLGNETSSFPSPVLMGEYSAVTNINTTDWTTQYLNTELTVFGWSAGSMFFNFNVNASANPIIGPPQIIGEKYSMLTMLQPGNDAGTFPTRDTSQSVIGWTNSLSQACGAAPSMSWQ